MLVGWWLAQGEAPIAVRPESVVEVPPLGSPGEVEAEGVALEAVEFEVETLPKRRARVLAQIGEGEEPAPSFNVASGRANDEAQAGESEREIHGWGYSANWVRPSAE